MTEWNEAIEAAANIFDRRAERYENHAERVRKDGNVELREEMEDFAKDARKDAELIRELKKKR